MSCVSVHSRRPQYQPLSLRHLQYLIDLGRLDTTQPIDLTQLVNSRGVTIQPLKRDFGVQLVDEVKLICTLAKRMTRNHQTNNITLDHGLFKLQQVGQLRPFIQLAHSKFWNCNGVWLAHETCT